MATNFGLTLRTTLFLALVAPGWAELAAADQPPDQYGDVVVESAHASPAKSGGESILRLRIVNEGIENAHFLGVETPFAQQARIVARTSDTETRIFESIGVLADGDLDLTTNHLWIELGPLVRDVSVGDSIPIELIFSRGRIPAEAHVHHADE